MHREPRVHRGRKGRKVRRVSTVPKARKVRPVQLVCREHRGISASKVRKACRGMLAHRA